MAPLSIERLYRPDGLWFWIWNGIVTAGMVLSVLLVFRRNSRWTRGRKLLAMEVRMEDAWEHTKAALQVSAAHRLTTKEKTAGPGAKETVLSNLGGGVTQQTVQQSKLSCDI